MNLALVMGVGIRHQGQGYKLRSGTFLLMPFLTEERPKRQTRRYWHPGPHLLRQDVALWFRRKHVRNAT